MNSLPIDLDAAALRVQYPTDDPQQGRFARPIGADEGHHLARLQGKINAFQDILFAVAGMNGFNAQHGSPVILRF
ncbi:hypothetical protein SDC9_168985 [bioreactor metagenome]|uniref:Uncharacterized protein n=1 Tax=bioreactor metagenome TaxID=1076179 RepID=A0A645G4N0_9ZZZZ